MLEGSGKALGFSPTTGGGKFCDLLAQPLTISSGSSKASKAAFLLFSVGIGNLLLVAGVDFTLAEGFAGVIQGHAHAFPVFIGAVALFVRQCCARGVAVMQGADKFESGGAERYKQNSCQRLPDVRFEFVEDHRQALHQNQSM